MVVSEISVFLSNVSSVNGSSVVAVVVSVVGSVVGSVVVGFVVVSND
jgi:hypothetical protein